MKGALQLNNEERLQEIIAVVDSQKESTRKMSVNDARWLIKRAKVLQHIIDAWIWIEAHGSQEDAIVFHSTVQEILDYEFR